ncbi:MAG TPA: tetratricopeptide repeat protein [Anaeromyxobacter sp.]|nr:tetratricopeptide repeat protein [Anaeromyxobacter sp.]
MSRFLAALLILASAAGARAAPRADREAMREARRAAAAEGARWASPRAIAHYLEARRHARAGDAEKAVEHLKLAVTYDDRSPELRVSLAQALALLGQLDAAEVEAKQALELDKGGPSASGAHALLGRMAAARHHTEQAVVQFKAAIRIETAISSSEAPPDPEPWRLLAATYVDAGEDDAAARTLEDLARRVPGDGSAFRELGRSYLGRRDAARAERHLRRAVQLDRRDVEAWRLLSEAHEGLRRDPDARDDLLAILHADADDPQALLALGRLAVRQGELAQAREWFHRHLRASPRGPDAHVRVVFQWLEGNHGAEALAAARAGLEDVGSDARLRFAEGLALQALRRWPESAEALAAVGSDEGELFVSARAAQAEALSRAGRHADAERALVPALARAPDDVRLLATRASVLDRAGRSPEAISLLRRAIADLERGAGPEDAADLYAALADSLVRAGRADEAVSSLREALAARPSDQALLYALGSTYESAGRRDAAVAQMRALLAINPDHAEALNFVGYTFAEQGVRLEEAERLVRRALELKPRSGHVLDSLGWVLFRRGDVRRAVEALEQADALAGPDATILEHLGDAYRAASRPADAARAYTRALANVGEELPARQATLRAEIEKKLRDVTGSSHRAGRR